MWFLGASSLENEKQLRKKQILLSLLEVEGQRVVSTFQLDEVLATDMLDKFQVFLDVLEKHLQFSGSVALERQKLRDRIRRTGVRVFSRFTASDLFLCLRPRA